MATSVGSCLCPSNFFFVKKETINIQLEGTPINWTTSAEILRKENKSVPCTLYSLHARIMVLIGRSWFPLM